MARVGSPRTPATPEPAASAAEWAGTDDELDDASVDTPDVATLGQSSSSRTEKMTDPYAKEWDDRHIYSASTLGECDVALAQRILGDVDPSDMPESLHVALEQGNINEPIILDMLLMGEYDHGEHERDQWRVYDEVDFRSLGIETGEVMERESGTRDYTGQPRVWLPILKSAVIRSHLDAIAVQSLSSDVGPVDGGRRVVEVKAFGDSYWNQWKSRGLASFPGYALQLSAQMYGAGNTVLDRADYMRALFIVGHKGEDGVVFEIDVQYVDEPPIAKGALVKKVLAVERIVKEYQASGVLPKCDEGRWPCPFYFTQECSGKPPAEVVLIDDLELGDAARRLWTASQDAKAAEGEKDIAKGQIKKLLEKYAVEAGSKAKVKDEAGNEYEVERVSRPMPESTRRAYTQEFAQVKLVGGAKGAPTGDAKEDAEAQA